MRLKFVSEPAPTGFGVAGRGYLWALHECRADITWTPMVVGRRWNEYLEPFEGESIDDEFASLCNRPIQYDAVIVNSVGVYFLRWRARETGKKWIGIAAWDAGRLMDGSLECLDCLDGLIVPCQWNLDVFQNSGVTCPIHLAPHVFINRAERGDCYVSLTRSEGWGLGAYEAAFSGKPVIITTHGGQLDFLPAELSYHVGFELVEAKPQGRIDAGYAGLLWAEPDLDDGAGRMREVFSNRGGARERGRLLRAFVTAEFQPRKIGAGILDFAASLHSGSGVPNSRIV